MSPAAVAIVLVSHSAKLAEGLAEVAAQMAPDVLIRPAGGATDDRIGTSFDRVTEATEELLAAPDVQGVALLTDLGSATLTAAAVLDSLDDPRAALVEGPLVEGAVAGAVAAQIGGDLDAVRRAVAGACVPVATVAAPEPTSAPPRPAGRLSAAKPDQARAAPLAPAPLGPGSLGSGALGSGALAPGPRAGAGPSPVRSAVPARAPAPAATPRLTPAGPGRPENPSLQRVAPGQVPVPARAATRGASPAPGVATRTLTLLNALGLHARPAALLARAVSRYDAQVTLNDVPAVNVLELMALGLAGGAELRLTARGPEAGAALDAVERLVAESFGE